MDECLLSLPKQSVESKTKMLVEFVQNLLQDGTKDESLSFTAFTRLMRDKKVRPPYLILAIYLFISLYFS